jgi:hypothetical protein
MFFTNVKDRKQNTEDRIQMAAGSVERLGNDR